MLIHCPQLNCISRSLTSPKLKHIVKKGYFFRKSDSRKIRRYICKYCNRQFSSSSLSPRYYQKVRRINELLRLLIVSGVSQRRAAVILRVNPKTVIRRFRFLAEQARVKQTLYLKEFEKAPLSEIQFDDLETSEHTKLKPLSVALAVEPKYRKILGFQVSRMPAKGLLAKKSVRKYGKRKDERERGWAHLLKNLKPILDPKVAILSDENPHYPRFIKKHFPNAVHSTVLGGRGAVTGQGELKKKTFDPMFALNHSCAMLRANLNRLFRKTWCTTKTLQGLSDHLALYVQYYNELLTRSYPLLGGS